MADVGAANARRRRVTVAHGTYFVDECNVRKKSLPPVLQPSRAPSSPNISSPSRKTSNQASFSPIGRKDVESGEFSIPQTHRPSMTSLSVLDLGSIDATLYEVDPPTPSSPKEGLGRVTCRVHDSKQEEKVRLTLGAVTYKFTPSNKFFGRTPAFEPVVVVRMRRLNIPTDIIQPFLTTSSTRQEQVLSADSPRCDISYQGHHLDDFQLEFQLFDASHFTDELALAYTSHHLQDLNSSLCGFVDANCQLYSAKGDISSPCGALVMAHYWNSVDEIYELTIDVASNIQNKINLKGKEFYVKVTVFDGAIEKSSYKTSAARADPVIVFDETLSIPMSCQAVKESTFLVELLERRSMIQTNSNAIGHAFVGPFMPYLSNKERIGIWEKTISFPNKLWTYASPLFP